MERDHQYMTDGAVADRTQRVRLLHRLSRISGSCLSQPAWTTMPKSTEYNLIVCIGNSEAEVTITEECTRGIILLKLTTDIHEASHGLSAIAELL